MLNLILGSITWDDLPLKNSVSGYICVFYEICCWGNSAFYIYNIHINFMLKFNVLRNFSSNEYIDQFVQKWIFRILYASVKG